MKKLIGTVLVVLCISATLHAQQKQATPGKEVKAAFEKKFPGATNVKWEKEDAGFEAGFKQNGADMSAVFESNGTLVETETTINTAQLPAAATTYIRQHYAGKKIKEAARIVKADGTVVYEAEINKKDVLFNEAGQFLKEG